MLFDKLCGIVESPQALHGPIRGEPLPPDLIRLLVGLRGLAADANVFEFPVVPHEIEFRQEVTRDNRELLGERFCLPFRTVAVEDKASCVILQDATPDAKGLAPRRGFVEVSPVYGDPANYIKRDRTAEQEYLRRCNIPADAVQVVWGALEDMKYEDFVIPRSSVSYYCGGAIIATKKRVFHYDLGEDAKADVKHALDNVRIGIEELAYANMPSRWVVEVLTAQSREEAKAGRLRRSHQRPRFTTLTPGELRTLFGREDDRERKSPVVHQRRGHWRLLRSERFAKSGLKGQHLWIEATWVGETEAVVGNKKYIVRTDL